MKKLVLIGLLLCALIFAFKPKVVKANPSDIWVPYNYPTIQAAINAADPGDVIHVASGTYGPIVVNKTVSIIAEGEAIIDGNYAANPVVNIIANNVVIKNFKIQRPSLYGTSIRINNASFCYVENNYIIGNMYGVFLWQTSNIRIAYNTIINVTGGNDWFPAAGILLGNSSNNYVVANNIYNSWRCISLEYSDFNLVSDNNVTPSPYTPYRTYYGIVIYLSSNNTVRNNWVTNCSGNAWAIYLSSASYNLIYHNNFINNARQAEISGTDSNKWYADWPTGGNFWSNHVSPDNFSGAYQNEQGSDGICDNYYIIDEYLHVIDAYPLMGPCNRFEVSFGPIPAIQEVSVISNSSISAFQMNTTQKTLSFNVSGNTGIGFCRVDIPNVIVSGLWQNNYRVLINNQAPLYVRNWTSGATTYIYFQYQHSTKEVIIIPESQFALIPLSLTLSTIILAFIKKIVQRKPKITPFSFLDSYNN
ncbi:MAG: NosD domain-containing protein [Candidatus Bathyarchaeia archaeon]